MENELPPIVRELKAHAGVTAAGPFDVTIDDVVIRVDYTTGSSPSISLSTPYAPRAGIDGERGYRDSAFAFAIPAKRPLSIQLSLESDHERSAKERGISREFSTGDAEFDRAVYIDSPAPDAVLSTLFGSRAVRDACRALLDDGFPEIQIDDDRGNITTRRGLSTKAKRSGVEVIRAFAAIARGVPAIEVTGQQSRRAASVVDVAATISVLVVAAVLVVMWGYTAWVFLIGATTALVPILWLVHLLMPAKFDAIMLPAGAFALLLGGSVALWLAEESWMPMRPTLGMAIGAVPGWLIGGRLYVRGRSNSHVRRWVSIALCTSIGALAGALVASLVAA